jgi:hypothetical protein
VESNDSGAMKGHVRLGSVEKESEKSSTSKAAELRTR